MQNLDTQIEKTNFPNKLPFYFHQKRGKNQVTNVDIWIKIPEDFLLLFKENSLFPIQNIQIKFLDIKQFSVGYFNNTLDCIKKK